LNFLEFFRHQTVFIGGWVRNLFFFRFFQIFRPQAIKKQSKLYLNYQIHIQTVEFEFKRINQKTPPHYYPPALTTSYSVDDTTRIVALDSTSTHRRYHRSSCHLSTDDG
jgi:hypothetical protein